MHPLVDAFYKGRGTLKKQTIKYFDDYKKPKKACHTGAIYFGLYGAPGIDLNRTIYDRINEDYPEFSQKKVSIPCEHRMDDVQEDSEIGAILIHLNDKHTAHTWNDKKVAEWLEKALTE